MTILLMPSLASVLMFARAGDIAGERADGWVGLLGRGCLSSRMGRSCPEAALLSSGGDRWGEYSELGILGVMLEVRGSGEPGRLSFRGGGVVDIGRGEWCRDDGGDGEAPGEEYSVEGLVTRVGCVSKAPKAGLADSSSEVAVSTSFNNDDKNEGSPPVSINGREGLPVALLD